MTSRASCNSGQRCRVAQIACRLWTARCEETAQSWAVVSVSEVTGRRATSDIDLIFCPDVPRAVRRKRIRTVRMRERIGFIRAKTGGNHLDSAEGNLITGFHRPVCKRPLDCRPVLGGTRFRALTSRRGDLVRVYD